MNIETTSSIMIPLPPMSKYQHRIPEKCDLCNKQRSAMLNGGKPMGNKKECITSLENKEQYRETQRKYISRLEKNKEYRNRPGYKEKMRTYMKAYVARPENKTRHCEAQRRYLARINTMKEVKQRTKNSRIHPKVMKEEQEVKV